MPARSKKRPTADDDKDNNNQKGGRRKSRRQRRDDELSEKLEQYGVDLPDIPGLPVPLIPLQVHALKTTVVCIKKDARQCVFLPAGGVKQTTTTTTTTRLASNNGDESSSSSLLLSGLMDRVGQASNAAETTQQGQDGEEAQQRRAQTQIDARQAWLQAIHRAIRDNATAATHQIPVAALQHLTELATQDRRRHVQRAALHLAGHLLTKSSDARRWWLEEADATTTAGGGLAAILDNAIPEKQQQQRSNNNNSTSSQQQQQQQRLLTREVYLWIQTLLEAGHGNLYPRLAVARQRLQQECPWVQREEEDNNDNQAYMATLQNWRHWRDLALQHYEEEEKRVQRLLRRCAACFETLVPRLDGDTTTEPAVNQQLEAKQGDDSDDDDENVDWEDGWEEEEDAQTHEAAVERTLAAIQATGAVENGGIEIDFSTKEKATPTVAAAAAATDESPAIPLARQRLTKCINILQTRHQPRLSRWIDGLTKSDQLRVVSTTGSLLPLEDDLKQKQKVAYETCLQLKESLGQALVSARRLGIPTPEETTEESRNDKNQNDDNKLDDGIDANVARLQPAAKHAAARSATRKRRQVHIKYKPT